MSKVDLVKEITVSLSRLGLFFTEECKEFLWSLSESQLTLILRFCTRLQKFYRKGK